MAPLYFGQELPSVHSRHAHIGHQYIRGCCRESLQSGTSAFGKLHAPLASHVMQSALHRLADANFVIDKEDSNHDAAGTGSASIGNRTVNTLPTPHSLSQRSVPPCL